MNSSRLLSYETSFVSFRHQLRYAVRFLINFFLLPTWSAGQSLLHR